jgi:hypothetical protein
MGYFCVIKGKGENKMKKYFVVFLVLMMAFAFAVPAAAKGNGPDTGNGVACGGNSTRGNSSVNNQNGSVNGQAQQGKRNTFAVTGTIVSIGTDTVTIDAVRGNKLVQPYLGSSITLTVTSQTRYLYNDGTSVTSISLSDLKVDQPVSVNGIFKNGVWSVLRITVGASLNCLP